MARSVPGQSGRRSNFNTIAALAFIVFGIVLFIVIPQQVDRPTLLFGQTPSGLDPDLFPRLVAGGFFALGLWYLVRSFRLAEKNGFVELDREAALNVGLTLVALLAYALLMEPLGFIASSILLVAFLSTFYGNRNIVLGALASIGVPLGIFFVFTRLLRVSLPEAALF
jgi:putative tricarboxylic transport membrane protein